jgi:hypothetical protein
MMMMMTNLYGNGIFLQNIHLDFVEHHLKTMAEKGEQVSSRNVTSGCETEAQRN